MTSESQETALGRDPDGSVATAEYVERRPLTLCRFGDSLYAFDAQSVAFVAPMEVPLRVPTAPPWILGVCYSRGRVLTVVDVKQPLGLAPTEGFRGRADDERASRLLVLVAGPSCFATLADEVLGLREVAVDSIALGGGESGGSFVLGSFEDERGRVTLLDVTLLFERLRHDLGSA